MTIPSIPAHATIGDKYHPAMAMTDPQDAQEYFRALVAYNVAHSNHSQEEAEAIEKSNLGYFAGYHNDAIRRRVERLFCCAHPVFGAIADKGSPSPEEALEAGIAMGNAARE